jgi:type III secretion protein F
MAATAAIFAPTATSGNPNGGAGNYVSYDGFDLIYRQQYLQTQMKSIETDIRNIEQNSNLSDTEKMFSMQMAMNSWSAISNLRTNMLKTVSDTLKSVARNVA